MTVAERTADIAHTHTDKQSSKYGEDGREEEREREAERKRERERERERETQPQEGASRSSLRLVSLAAAEPAAPSTLVRAAQRQAAAAVSHAPERCLPRANRQGSVVEMTAKLTGKGINTQQDVFVSNDCKMSGEGHRRASC